MDISVMTLSLIGRLEIGYIILEVKVRDLVNRLYWNLSGLDWTLVDIYIYIYILFKIKWNNGMMEEFDFGKYSGYLEDKIMWFVNWVVKNYWTILFSKIT